MYLKKRRRDDDLVSIMWINDITTESCTSEQRDEKSKNNCIDRHQRIVFLYILY